MQTRSAVLQSFLDGLHEAILAGAAPRGPARRAATKIFDALGTPAAETPHMPVRSPVADHLHRALTGARAQSGSASKVAEAFAELEPSLTWCRRPGADSDPVFAAGHSNASILGPNGLEARGDVWVGVIPTRGDQHPLAHSRRPMDMILQG